MKRAFFVALLVFGCSLPGRMDFEPGVALRDRTVYLLSSDEPVAEVTGIDWSWYTGRVYKSYHVRMLDKRYTIYEVAIVNYLSYTNRSATEVHVSY